MFEENLIKRGLTPYQRFYMPYDEADVESLAITYAQNGNEILSKGKDDVTWDEEHIYVRLSQADTLSFAEGAASVDMRVRLTNGDVPGTYRYLFYVIDTNKDGEI